EDAERALAIRPDLAEAHDLVSRISEHVGDERDATAHAQEAARLDPETFPLPLEIGDDDFDAIVERCVKELPERVRRELGEVPVLVQPLPTRAMLESEGNPLPPDLLGLFVGRHLLERSLGDVAGAPGNIYLFRRNLLRACTDREELE